MRVTKVLLPVLKDTNKPVELTFEKDFIQLLFIVGGGNGVGKSRFLELLFTLLTCWEVPHRNTLLRKTIEAYIPLPSDSSCMVAQVTIWDGTKEHTLEFSVKAKGGLVEYVHPLSKELQGVIDPSRVYLINHLCEPRAFVSSQKEDLSAYEPNLRMVKSINPQYLNYEDLYGNKAQWNNLSVGKQKYYSLSDWVIRVPTKECIVLLDNPDVFLHPDWQYEISRTCSSDSKGGQFIVCTHSYAMCEALTPPHVKDIYDPSILNKEY